ncbi:unnamed protein product [Aphanomyces euteiches]
MVARVSRRWTVAFAFAMIAIVLVLQFAFSSIALTKIDDNDDARRTPLRAIVVNVPPGEQAVTEFAWLYSSWKETLRHQPHSWRTDLIVLSDDTTLPRQFRCLTGESRQNHTHQSECILVPLNSHETATQENVLLVHTMETIATSDIFDQYDWLLTTPTNAILAPAFDKWTPAQLTVGGARDKLSLNALARLSKSDSGSPLSIPSLDGFGDAWYGPTTIIKACAKRTLELISEWDHGKTPIKPDDFKHLPKLASLLALQDCADDLIAYKPSMLDASTDLDDDASSHAHLRPPSDFRTALGKQQVKNTTNTSQFALDIGNGALKYLSSTSSSPKNSFVRAAVIYLPPSSTPDSKFFKQFRWFLLSWKIMMRHEPTDWRTDVVVFTDGDIPLLDELNCTKTIRRSPADPNRCIIVDKYKKVKSKDFDYGFADSINVAAIDSAATEPYDWVLRTDIDTFFTPAFATWKPTKLVVGSVGGYCFGGQTTCDRLKQIAKKLNLAEPNYTDNVGSTWYGPAKLIKKCAQTSMRVIKHLHEKEFNETEKSVEYYLYTAKGWPSWHYGVLTMYSGHLAIHDCTSDVGGFEKNDDMIDYSAAASDQVSRHAHLHTWQSPQDNFDKGKFFAGEYKHLDPNSLDREKVYGYALQIALVANAKKDTSLQHQGQSFVRAVLVYLDTDASTTQSRFRWLHQSWQIMTQHQPAKWRTDLVVFVKNRASYLDDLNCGTSVRGTREEPDRCIVVSNYQPLQTKSFNVANADTLNILAVDNAATDNYDYLMRTDVESFLTPLFSTWKPAKMTFGDSGGYCWDNQPTFDRLKAVSQKLGLTEPSMVNIGQTWYGPAKLMKACGKLSVKAMKHLHENEFTEKEMSHAYVRDAKGWPAWHYGVLYRYASHVAMYECTKDDGYELDKDMIDFTTASKDQVTWHAHLRAEVDTKKDFSMTKYHAKGYDNVELSALNQSQIDGYSTFLAVAANSKLLTFDNGISDVFVRAAVVFLPYSDSNDRFMKQFRWFHLSWKTMLEHQPKLWRTDIVVFTDGDIPLLKELDCVKTIRKSNDDPNRCIIVDTYTKVKSKDFDYGFADSINVVAIDSAATKPYDWILRTDIDTFLTPVFASWKPFKLTVGSVSGYCFDGETTCDRLKTIAKKLNLAEPNYTKDVGSTWYGPGKVIQKCAQTSMRVIKHLHEKEFSDEEKSVEYYLYTAKGWPSWHYGVLTMYSGHLAIHDCTSDVGGFDKRNDLIDYSASSTDMASRHAHLHAWQSPQEHFDKNKFFEGKYDDMDYKSMKPDRVYEYALQMALQSNAKADIDVVSNSTFIRAVVVYFPDSGEISTSQMRWLHKSWQTMIQHQPSKWRTDLVIFTTHRVSFLDDLNCQEGKRIDANESNKCIFVSDYKAIRSKEYDLDFGDSINVVAEDHPATDPYDYLMMTEIEAFLTPAFATWKPSKLTFGVTGSYTDDKSTLERLKDISAKLKLAAPSTGNAGQAWYGPAKQIKSCAKLTVRVLQHLIKDEFTALEKSNEYHHAARGWPKWHYGVAHRYASHIAMYECTKTDGFNVDRNMIDFTAASKDSIDLHAHIRPTWSGNDDFAESKFFKKDYDSVDLASLNQSQVAGYATYMAVQGNGVIEYTNGIDDTFVRVAIVYLPASASNDRFMKQFRWFHLSWKIMLEHQPTKWRTDIVVFTDGDIPLLKELDCVKTIRKSNDDPNRCIIVDTYTKVKSKDFDYGFADSINVVAIDSAATKPYDWTLRTDIDTFLTPLFGTWKPRRVTVGSVGGYCYDGETTFDRLKTIAKKLNLAEPNYTKDVGSTWYGPTKLIQTCAQTSMRVIKHLHEKEFNETEKSVEYYLFKAKGWPSWHYGVLTMYSGHLAIHDCTSDVGGFDKRDDMIDYPAHSTDKVSRHAHLHAWQSPKDNFDKGKFFEGKYDGMDYESIEPNRVFEYAMQVALRSNDKNGPKEPLPESFIRAAVVYLPGTRERQIDDQFRWFHHSWAEMIKHQPQKWRMDLVVFTTSNLPLLADLNCTTTIRSSPNEPSRCIMVPNYTSVLSNDFFNRFADTFNVVALNHSATAPYEWIIQTETDSFFTPAFAKWKPSKLTIGEASSYCWDGQPTCDRLVRIAKKLNYATPKKMNVGITWYGPAELMRSCAKTTLDAMHHLHDFEFNATERSYDFYASKIKGWPHWHFGILHSYAAHLGFQHCTRLSGYEIRGDMLDFTSSSNKPVSKHAHLRPTTNPGGNFSSRHFHDEDYVDTDTTKLDQTTVSGYATYHALVANRFAEAELMNGVNESFTRAAVVYLPTGGTKFMREFHWFHQSWKEMIKHQPAKWRTDIVVFTDDDGDSLKDLGCRATIRTHETQSDMCVIVPRYVKVHSATFDYRFADSINVVGISSPATAAYDWILRTDIDTFLTPVFGSWKPRRFTVGSVGGYCFDSYDTCYRLRGIANKLNLTPADVLDIGSTWYGPRKLIQACGNLSMAVVNHFHLNEFNETERNKYNWPAWHYGVLTMYSGHLAIPHCTASTGFDKRDDMIDFPAHSTDKVSPHAHLHAWQEGVHDFSKLKFQQEKYKNVEVKSLDVSKVNGYAMYSALVGNHEGKR